VTINHFISANAIANPSVAMLHRLFTAATSAAALKGRTYVVEEEETVKSKQLLYGYPPYPRQC
jgi:hypothetical protein